MNSPSLQPNTLPPWRRWLLAAAILLDAAWIALLAILAVTR
jgi:hypothetical protein